MTFTAWQIVLLIVSLGGFICGLLKLSFDLYDKGISFRFAQIKENESAMLAKIEKHSSENLRREDWLREITRNQSQMDKIELSIKELAKQISAPRGQ